MARKTSDCIVGHHTWKVGRIHDYSSARINGVPRACESGDDSVVSIRFSKLCREKMASLPGKFADEPGARMSIREHAAMHPVAKLHDARCEHVPVLAIAQLNAPDVPHAVGGFQ